MASITLSLDALEVIPMTRCQILCVLGAPTVHGGTKRLLERRRCLQLVPCFFHGLPTAPRKHQDQVFSHYRKGFLSYANPFNAQFASEATIRSSVSSLPPTVTRSGLPVRVKGSRKQTPCMFLTYSLGSFKLNPLLFFTVTPVLQYNQ